MGKFEVYKDKKGEFRWRLIASNGRIIANGEGYKSKRNCKDGIYCVSDCLFYETLPVVEVKK